MDNPVFLGIDIGTSGIRASCIDDDGDELTSHHISFTTHLPENGKNEQDPDNWRRLLDQLLTELSNKRQTLGSIQQISAIAIDGTSSTLIACKKDGTALSPALMYNDQQSDKQAALISRFAPAESAVHGASSSLAKAIRLLQQYPETEIFCHQADWLASSLTGVYGISDENNCLKLGYDSITQSWPDWLTGNNESIRESLLPRVVSAGSKIGDVRPELIDRYQLASNCIMVAGTTDSNAAVLATGANQICDAVTSLGSTLVVKLFSDRPVFDPEYGIYSHRLNDHWLVGGASNSGGSVLLQHFTQTQLDVMTPLLDPSRPTGLDYYPLPGTGERFPVNDSKKQCRITPRPESDVEFFQALLEGMAKIEADGYHRLMSLGAVPVKRIYTAGGGSKNPAWKQIRERIIRERMIDIEVITAERSEACYGSALLARQGFIHSN